MEDMIKNFFIYYTFQITKSMVKRIITPAINEIAKEVLPPITIKEAFQLGIEYFDKKKAMGSKTKTHETFIRRNSTGFNQC